MCKNMAYFFKKSNEIKLGENTPKRYLLKGNKLKPIEPMYSKQEVWPQEKFPFHRHQNPAF